MCGRYSNATTWAQVHAFSQPLVLDTPKQDPDPCYNIAPTQRAWVIRAAEDGSGQARQMQWGLLPAWSGQQRMAFSTFNARAETADRKPVFRNAWKQRRGLVPASGYYEWQQGAGGTKQPWFVHPARGPVMLFGALWEPGTAADGSPRDSFTIVTRPAWPGLAHLHDRSPVMLTPDLLSDWLLGPPQRAREIALDGAEPAIAMHAVDRAVGNVRNQGPQLATPAQAAVAPESGQLF
jgi:putative SOS response-associated peptidase YedK